MGVNRRTLKPKTALRFAERYANRSNLTLERLIELGQYVAVCDCGASYCGGWQMLSRQSEGVNPELIPKQEWPPPEGEH